MFRIEEYQEHTQPIIRPDTDPLSVYAMSRILGELQKENVGLVRKSCRGMYQGKVNDIIIAACGDIRIPFSATKGQQTNGNFFGVHYRWLIETCAVMTCEAFAANTGRPLPGNVRFPAWVTEGTKALVYARMQAEGEDEETALAAITGGKPFPPYTKEDTLYPSGVMGMEAGLARWAVLRGSDRGKQRFQAMDPPTLNRHKYVKWVCQRSCNGCHGYFGAKGTEFLCPLYKKCKKSKSADGQLERAYRLYAFHYPDGNKGFRIDVSDKVRTEASEKHDKTYERLHSTFCAEKIALRKRQRAGKQTPDERAKASLSNLSKAPLYRVLSQEAYLEHSRDKLNHYRAANCGEDCRNCPIPQADVCPYSQMVTELIGRRETRNEKQKQKAAETRQVTDQSPSLESRKTSQKKSEQKRKALIVGLNAKYNTPPPSLEEAMKIKKQNRTSTLPASNRPRATFAAIRSLLDSQPDQMWAGAAADLANSIQWKGACDKLLPCLEKWKDWMMDEAGINVHIREDNTVDICLAQKAGMKEV